MPPPGYAHRGGIAASSVYKAGPRHGEVPPRGESKSATSHSQWRNQRFEPGGEFSEGGPLAIILACNNWFLNTHKHSIYMGVPYILGLRFFAPQICGCKSSSIPRSW